MADAKISALSDGGLVQAADELVVARAGANYHVSPAGVPVLVYRYTVTGSDKASIDTGVDTADAGSNNWANGDLLEAFIFARTDEAVVFSVLSVTLNNDTSSIYDQEFVGALNATVSGGNNIASANWPFMAAGSSCASGVAATNSLVIPDYAGTVFNKHATLAMCLTDTTAANTLSRAYAMSYRSTTAVTRLAVTPATGGKKLKVGSQLLIYKRLAS